MNEEKTLNFDVKQQIEQILKCKFVKDLEIKIQCAPKHENNFSPCEKIKKNNVKLKLQNEKVNIFEENKCEEDSDEFEELVNIDEAIEIKIEENCLSKEEIKFEENRNCKIYHSDDTTSLENYERNLKNFILELNQEENIKSKDNMPLKLDFEQDVQFVKYTCENKITPITNLDEAIEIKDEENILSIADTKLVKNRHCKTYNSNVQNNIYLKNYKGDFTLELDQGENIKVEDITIKLHVEQGVQSVENNCDNGITPITNLDEVIEIEDEENIISIKDTELVENRYCKTYHSNDKTYLENYKRDFENFTLELDQKENIKVEDIPLKLHVEQGVQFIENKCDNGITPIINLVEVIEIEDEENILSIKDTELVGNRYCETYYSNDKTYLENYKGDFENFTLELDQEDHKIEDIPLKLHVEQDVKFVKNNCENGITPIINLDEVIEIKIEENCLNVEDINLEGNKGHIINFDDKTSLGDCERNFTLELNQEENIIEDMPLKMDVEGIVANKCENEITPLVNLDEEIEIKVEDITFENIRNCELNDKTCLENRQKYLLENFTSKLEQENVKIENGPLKFDIEEEVQFVANRCDNEITPLVNLDEEIEVKVEDITLEDIRNFETYSSDKTSLENYERDFLQNYTLELDEEDVQLLKTKLENERHKGTASANVNEVIEIRNKKTSRLCDETYLENRQKYLPENFTPKLGQENVNIEDPLKLEVEEDLQFVENKCVGEINKNTKLVNLDKVTGKNHDEEDKSCKMYNFNEKCIASNYKTSSNIKALTEMSNINIVKRLICFHCEKSFTKRYKLKEHVLLKHGSKDELHVCPYCDKKYTLMSNLKKHLRVMHICPREYKCMHCLAVFKIKRNLRRHFLNGIPLCQKRTVNEKDRCNICLQQLSSQNSLRRHLKTHLGAFDYKCSICHKLFREYHQLQRHQKLHENPKYNFSYGCKPHAVYCFHCGRGFARKVDLANHMKTHTGIRDYKCSFCPKTYTRNGHLNEHIKLAHYS